MWFALAGGVFAPALAGAADGALAQADTPVVVSGTIGDEADRAALRQRLAALYGRERLRDQTSLSPGAVAHWRADVDRLLFSGLRQVHKGQLVLDGQRIALRGEVPSEAVKQEVLAELSRAADGRYTLLPDLKVVVPEQVLIDQALANRTVEFQAGSAVLTPAGARLLDEMAAVLGRFKNRRFELIGHTDGQGARQGNLALALARAQAVKDYLVDRGLRPEQLDTKGMGPDQPIASNASESGRARNRRIEFKLVQPA